MGFRATINVLKDTITPRLNDAYLERLVGTPLRDELEQWLDKDVLPRAQRGAPRDLGNLGDKLTTYVGPGVMPKSAGIRSNSRHFWFVHGRHELPAPPRRRSRPHFPPDTQSIRGWSVRHGIPVFMVRRAISKRGTPIVPFVDEAITEALPLLERRMRSVETAIEREWNHGPG